jgi:hypothetical protein
MWKSSQEKLHMPIHSAPEQLKEDLTGALQLFIINAADQASLSRT